MMIKIYLFIQIVFFLFFLYSDPSENMKQLLFHLKNHRITPEKLEKTYSCHPLNLVITSSLSSIHDIESEIRRSRSNTKLSALLPKITLWGKMKNDQKIYLYQKNNISVGKDYVSVGPDDNNTTEGDLDSYELGARLSFDLTNLLHNKDTLRYASEEKSLVYYKKELIENISYIYYYRAIMNAVNALEVDIPAEERLFHETSLRFLTSWVKEISGMEIQSCEN